MDFVTIPAFVLIAIIIAAVLALPSIAIRLVRKSGPIEFTAKGWTIAIVSFILLFYFSAVYYLSIANEVHTEDANKLIDEFLTSLPFKTHFVLAHDIKNIIDLPFLPIIFYFVTLIIVPNVIALITDIKKDKAKIVYALITVLVFGIIYAIMNTVFDSKITPFTASAFSVLLGVPIGFGIYNSFRKDVQ